MQTLKNVVRIVEKAVMNADNPGNCKRVFDVVRGMVECRTMTAVAQVLSNLDTNQGIELVRMKDRFLTEPSPGGWRDCMVCFVINDDPNQHVCEVQLVHHDLLTARKGLPGHSIYNRARNASELLEVLWATGAGSTAYFEPAWTGRCVSNVCACAFIRSLLACVRQMETKRSHVTPCLACHVNATQYVQLPN
jgi:hypothetical protein